MGANCLDINWLNLVLCPSCPNRMLGGKGLTILSLFGFRLLELPPCLLDLLLATDFLLLGSLSMSAFKFIFGSKVIDKEDVEGLKRRVRSRKYA